MQHRIQISTPNSGSYDIVLGARVLDELGEAVRDVEALAGAERAFIISDSNVAPLYLSRVVKSLRGAGFKTNDYTIPAGEASKNVDALSDLWEIMAHIGVTRDSFIVALGGGVVGDIAGFAAATYMRGIQYVQVPTTLLAMVDSSVGGKTAVNLSSGKNLVGSFKQPVLVYADTETLNTLNEREWKCGLGEVAKSALLGGGEFFDWLLEHADDISWEGAGCGGKDAGGSVGDGCGGSSCDSQGNDYDGDTRGNQHNITRDDLLATAIQQCVEFKARVVEQDEFESKGVRECLNYGHTLAHAIETLSGYGTYSHGAAVAMGMRFAAVLNCELADGDADNADCKAGSDSEKEVDSAFAKKQGELLDKLGLTIKSLEGTSANYASWKSDPKRVLACMKRDKKTRGGRVRFVLLDSVGAWQIREVDDEVILSALKN